MATQEVVRLERDTRKAIVASTLMTRKYPLAAGELRTGLLGGADDQDRDGARSPGDVRRGLVS